MQEYALGMAGIMSSVHMMRIMVNRGLVSPNEVETFYAAIIDTLAEEPELQAITTARLDAPIAEIREWAERLWIGKGQTNPS